ncbi:AmmeMemoRadiSam system protein A [Desulfopila sp. IMCC35008]|uniref:AmmeMemoRadiSam system protein A n=1 Tax=Desulfopila sp. IMCC35008 TaxID=2653858 RepID=UPI0013D25BA3|nr:AmmeMemoRadiSam system protein A [Desulfopila sp. IMCC35008]
MSDTVTSGQADLLLRLARKTIRDHLTMDSDEACEPPGDDVFDEEGATFVTLKRDGQLRGCIGNLEPSGTLWESIRRNAINAAFYDSRFSPLTEDELADVHIDISILSQPRPLYYTDANDLLVKLCPGKDGVVLRHRGRGATFLPQVWEQLPSVELFLGHLCRKAGLADDCWQTEHPEILVYQVQSFAEENK